jgi:hypothetical protein
LGVFNTAFLPIDRSSTPKPNKETSEVNDTIDPMDLIEIYRIFYPTAAAYTFFLEAHGNF